MEAQTSGWPIGPPALRLIEGGAYSSYVNDSLDELYRLLMRLADGADPVRSAVLRAWARIVREWLPPESR